MTSLTIGLSNMVDIAQKLVFKRLILNELVAYYDSYVGTRRFDNEVFKLQAAIEEEEEWLVKQLSKLKHLTAWIPV